MSPNAFPEYPNTVIWTESSEDPQELVELMKYVKSFVIEVKTFRPIESDRFVLGDHVALLHLKHLIKRNHQSISSRCLVLR